MIITKNKGRAEAAHWLASWLSAGLNVESALTSPTRDVDLIERAILNAGLEFDTNPILYIGSRGTSP